MLKVRVKNFQIATKLFKYGVYFHVRTGYTWRHLKIGGWTQNGVRMDSARQKYRKRKGFDPKPRRYGFVIRLQYSYWKSTYGKNCKPYVGGGMFYWGKGEDLPK
jgi:hypothetical protein